MQNDKQIIISAAGSRKATVWTPQTLYWSELVEKLRVPARGTETLAEYMKLPKAKQDDLKDVGGFVAGALKDNKRKAANVLGRDVITLDLDNIPSGGTVDTLRRLEGLGCSYATYSTRKHSEVKPRLRILVPLNRTASADEYEPLARKLASFIGIELADPTTFEASRLMYWPSCSLDSQYIFQFGDRPFLDVDGLLATYGDWRNINEWPEVPGVGQAHIRLKAKQGNPTEKKGPIGAFCRQYDIHKAIEVFLPGIYTLTDDGSGRYTFVGGSTVGGAITYDDGLFLYSHHATDPCSGRLVNAFDLVRLHKFGDLDDEAKPDTPTNRLPSFVAMAKFVGEDPETSRKMLEEDFGQKDRFQELNLEWLNQLEKLPTGKWASNSKNVKLILRNDPAVAGKFARDIFSYKTLLLESVPWRRIFKPQIMDDNDEAGLRNFLSDEYHIRNGSVVADALSEVLLSQEYHPVREYLSNLRWDGIKRVETLLVDYLGAENDELTRAMTRLTLIGAVARVFHPGCKFDYVLTLIGKQGIGKSSLLDLLGGEWFTDSIDDIRGKEAYERIQGSWIIELGELAALRKAEIEAVKRFVSARVDKFRQSFGKRSNEYPRQCIFIASTNEEQPLKDQTGNRRFWPVKVGLYPIDLSKRKNFPRDQIWAEAVEIYKKGEPLFLPRHLEKQVEDLQKAYTEESVYAGIIREHLDKPWGSEFDKTEVKHRVCAIEIWCEMLGHPRDKFTTAKAREINLILKSTPGWRVYPKNNGRTRHGKYGIQTVFERVSDVSD
ncbi:virulence-associated E family protein [Niallia circulans]|uniref:Virulence-associated protein E n=1 Tax=Niallia circulans TaxID=1397 RepID=A0A941JHC5_NIACI|nr:virulence-associated E family protein [Niallia circulans]MCB5238903.1 virulence-associated E family protein [Niallia circulans]